MKTKNLDETFVREEWSSLSRILKKILKYLKSEAHDSYKLDFDKKYVTSRIIFILKKIKYTETNMS